MLIRTFIEQIFREIWCYKLRSSLAVFCVAFGVYILAMLTSLSSSFCEANKAFFEGVADNAFIVWKGGTSKSYAGYPKGHEHNIMPKDIVELPKIFPNIEAASMKLNKGIVISYKGKTYNNKITGVNPSYINLSKMVLTPGSRFFNENDIKNNSRVTIIKEQLKKVLFGKDKAIGKKILIDGVPFTVIGVVKKSKGGVSDFSEAAFISYKSYITLYGEQPIWVFWVLVKPEASPLQIEQALRAHFARKNHFDKNDKEAMGLWGSGKMYKVIQIFFIVMRLFFIGCGVMVLAVGSIGVANIMFSIVSDKTYAIGLHKAIGATNRQIFAQLLLESLVISGIGGILGMAGAFFTTVFLQNTTILPNWIGKPILSWPEIIITISILILVALITGFFPARKAARMDPVEALA